MSATTCSWSHFLEAFTSFLFCFLTLAVFLAGCAALKGKARAAAANIINILRIILTLNSKLLIVNSKLKITTCPW